MACLAIATLYASAAPVASCPGRGSSYSWACHVLPHKSVVVRLTGESSVRPRRTLCFINNRYCAFHSGQLLSALLCCEVICYIVLTATPSFIALCDYSG